MEFRKPKRYGNVMLSVQASSFHYCTPRADGLPLHAYSEVEIALTSPAGRIVRPEGYVPGEFYHLWEGGPSPVAAYVTQAQLRAIRKALRERANQ